MRRSDDPIAGRGIVRVVLPEGVDRDFETDAVQFVNLEHDQLGGGEAELTVTSGDSPVEGGLLGQGAVLAEGHRVRFQLERAGLERNQLPGAGDPEPEVADRRGERGGLVVSEPRR